MEKQLFVMGVNMKVITNFKKDGVSFKELIEKIFINYYKSLMLENK